MADPDDRMPLPEVPRTNSSLYTVGRPGAHVRSDRVDPALSIWHDFVAARACARKLTHRQQAIESVMVERAGFPVIHVPLTGGGHVSVVGLEDIEDLMEEHAAEVQFSEAERASLAAHQALWSATDRELGYSAALRAEGRALDHVRKLAEQLWATPAASLGGVIAKLDVLLSEGAPSSEAEESPWPQLRAIRADLEVLLGTRSSIPLR